MAQSPSVRQLTPHWLAAQRYSPHDTGWVEHCPIASHACAVVSPPHAQGVPAGRGPQTPSSAPVALLAARQLEQTSAHGLLQQTPSTQAPLRQSVLPMHAAPSACLRTQTPMRQTAFEAQISWVPSHGSAGG